jgi:hypothetical protein
MRVFAAAVIVQDISSGIPVLRSFTVMHDAEKQCLCRTGAPLVWKDATDARRMRRRLMTGRGNRYANRGSAMAAAMRILVVMSIGKVLISHICLIHTESRLCRVAYGMHRLYSSG